MPNWCATNFILRGRTEDINRFCDTVNSCLDKTDIMKNGFGKFWLGNICVAFGYEYKDEYDLRGSLSPEPDAVACWGGPQCEPGKLIPEKLDKTNSQICFSTETAWEPSGWLFIMLRQKFPGIVVAYKTTDEFGNFHKVKHSEIMCCFRYEINYDKYDDCEKSFYIDGEDGDEELIAEKLKVLGLNVTSEDVRTESGHLWDEITTFNNANEDKGCLEFIKWDEVEN